VALTRSSVTAFHTPGHAASKLLSDPGHYETAGTALLISGD